MSSKKKEGAFPSFFYFSCIKHLLKAHNDNNDEGGDPLGKSRNES